MQKIMFVLMLAAVLVAVGGCQGVFMTPAQSERLDTAALDSDGVQNAVNAGTVTEAELVKAIETQDAFWRWVVSQRIWMSANYYVLVGQSQAVAHEATIRALAGKFSLEELKSVYTRLNGYLHRLANARDGIAGPQPANK